MQRRWFQFRLRTLLAVVTVAAVGCAWVAREGRVVQERRAVRQWIEANDIATLNVAGPRESSSPGIGDDARRFLRQLLL